MTWRHQLINSPFHYNSLPLPLHTSPAPTILCSPLDVHSLVASLRRWLQLLQIQACFTTSSPRKTQSLIYAHSYMLRLTLPRCEQTNTLLWLSYVPEQIVYSGFKGSVCRMFNQNKEPLNPL